MRLLIIAFGIRNTNFLEYRNHDSNALYAVQRSGLRKLLQSRRPICRDIVVLSDRPTVVLSVADTTILFALLEVLSVYLHVFEAKVFRTDFRGGCSLVPLDGFSPVE